MTFQRYAIFYLPPPDAGWTRFATSWLGWDAESGASVAHPALDDLPVGEITKTPRKYGLHGTLKPPFRLADDTDSGALDAACLELARSLAPVRLEGLELTRMGRFLALCPRGDQTAIARLAARTVRKLDRFRAPSSEAELARRRGKGLNEQQDRNLRAWGYPFVMDQFRFHITLTGRLDPALSSDVCATLRRHLVPILPDPFDVPDLALIGEAADGRFHMIRRYALSG
ncbi:MAG: DUF1045 domain-containing protein [Pseudomonadota bacterium]